MIGKNIGILTFQNADNYGAMLQAYALYKSVQKILPESNVEFLNYIQPQISRKSPPFPTFNSSFLFNLIKYLWKLKKFYNKNAAIRRDKFSLFRKNELRLSKEVKELDNVQTNYDIIIVGSDQVWNMTLSKNDPTYFLKQVNCKKISYAASYGHEVLSKHEIEFSREFLPSFNKISVREKSAVKALRDLQLFSDHVLDPVLLFNKEDWYNSFTQSSKSKISQNYLLIYALELNPEVYKIASKVAEVLNLIVVEIGFGSLKRDYQKVDLTVDKNGPLEFISLFKNASFVVTNSFHGTAFSALFEKDFFSVPHQSRGTRMTSLLEVLKLNDRIIYSHKDVFKSNERLKINYKTSCELLKQEQAKSINYLKEALLNE